MGRALAELKKRLNLRWLQENRPDLNNQKDSRQESLEQDRIQEKYGAEPLFNCVVCDIAAYDMQDDELCDGCFKTHKQCAVCQDYEPYNEMTSCFVCGQNYCAACDKYDSCEEYAADEEYTEARELGCPICSHTLTTVSASAECPMCEVLWHYHQDDGFSYFEAEYESEDRGCYECPRCDNELSSRESSYLGKHCYCNECQEYFITKPLAMMASETYFMDAESMGCYECGQDYEGDDDFRNCDLCDVLLCGGCNRGCEGCSNTVCNSHRCLKDCCEGAFCDECHKEEFEAVAVYQGKKPEGAVAKALLQKKLMDKAEILESIQKLENDVRLGLISEEEIMRQLQDKFGAEEFCSECSNKDAETFEAEHRILSYVHEHGDDPYTAITILLTDDSATIENANEIIDNLVDEYGYDSHTDEGDKDLIIYFKDIRGTLNNTLRTLNYNVKGNKANDAIFEWFSDYDYPIGGYAAETFEAETSSGTQVFNSCWKCGSGQHLYQIARYPATPSEISGVGGDPEEASEGGKQRAGN